MTEPILLRGLAGEPSSILIRDGRIAALDDEAADAGTDARMVLLEGVRAVPGFIELQVNGAGKHDFTIDPGSIWTVGRELARHGVTAFLPTIVTSPRGSVEAALETLAQRPADSIGAVPLGLHVEGPFISPVRHGAHDERHLRHPDRAEIEAWLSGGMCILTIAPELPGAIEAIERVAASGAVASVGHTDADAAAVARAIDAGARYATHLFNAMPPLHHRTPGCVATLLDDERVTVGLIADGVHLDPFVLRLVHRLAGERVSLVSDAVAHQLGDRALTVDDASARLPDGTLAGSVHPLDHGVRTFATATGSLAAALAAVTTVPARLLRLADGRGSLRVGGRADVTLLDESLRVVATFVAGVPAHVTERLAWR